MLRKYERFMTSIWSFDGGILSIHLTGFGCKSEESGHLPFAGIARPPTAVTSIAHASNGASIPDAPTPPEGHKRAPAPASRAWGGRGHIPKARLAREERHWGQRRPAPGRRVKRKTPPRPAPPSRARASGSPRRRAKRKTPGSLWGSRASRNDARGSLGLEARAAGISRGGGATGRATGAPAARRGYFVPKMRSPASPRPGRM